MSWPSSGVGSASLVAATSVAASCTSSGTASLVATSVAAPVSAGVAAATVGHRRHHCRLVLGGERWQSFVQADRRYRDFGGGEKHPIGRLKNCLVSFFCKLAITYMGADVHG